MSAVGDPDLPSELRDAISEYTRNAEPFRDEDDPRVARLVAYTARSYLWTKQVMDLLASSEDLDKFVRHRRRVLRDDLVRDYREALRLGDTDKIMAMWQTDPLFFLRHSKLRDRDEISQEAIDCVSWIVDRDVEEYLESGEVPTMPGFYTYLVEAASYIALPAIFLRVDRVIDVRHAAFYLQVFMTMTREENGDRRQFLLGLLEALTVSRMTVAVEALTHFRRARFLLDDDFDALHARSMRIRDCVANLDHFLGLADLGRGPRVRVDNLALIEAVLDAIPNMTRHGDHASVNHLHHVLDSLPSVDINDDATAFLLNSLPPLSVDAGTVGTLLAHASPRAITDFQQVLQTWRSFWHREPQELYALFVHNIGVHVRHMAPHHAAAIEKIIADAQEGEESML
jgi:hypothetical protein